MVIDWLNWVTYQYLIASNFLGYFRNLGDLFRVQEL